MNVISRILNFILGLIGAILIVLGLTSQILEKRSQMIIIGVGLFILTLIIHLVMQIMDSGSKAY